VIPTLLAGLAGVGAILGWQHLAAASVRNALRGTAPPPLGDVVAWMGTTIGPYAIMALLLYIPIAAVQPRTNPVRAIGMGLRFGLRSWGATIGFMLVFAIPALVVQYVLEKHGAFLVTRLRPEVVVAFLAFYAAAASVATYLSYVTGARLYRMARGET
jgi:hypothetical protein